MVDNKPAQFTCDVAVIGAGTAGLAAERVARSEGARTLLIDDRFAGTTCATVGCMPSKLLVTAGMAAQSVRREHVFGIDATPHVDGARVMHRVRQERNRFVAATKRGFDPRTVTAIAAWTKAAAIINGPLFRRVLIRRYNARAAMNGQPIASISGRETWDLRQMPSKPAVSARVAFDIKTAAVPPGSIDALYRPMIRRAFECGARPDLSADDLRRLINGSTRSLPPAHVRSLGAKGIKLCI